MGRTCGPFCPNAIDDVREETFENWLPSFNALLDTGPLFALRTGNRGLCPIEMWKYDLSVEWYFDRVGSLTVNGFIKDLGGIVDYVVEVVNVSSPLVPSLDVELIDTHSDHVERELGAAISVLQPDGVVLTPPHSENRLITGLLTERGIPFVRIGSNTPGPGIALTMGDEGAGHLATTRLIALGHRRIGMIAGRAQYSLSGCRI